MSTFGLGAAGYGGDGMGWDGMGLHRSALTMAAIASYAFVGWYFITFLHRMTPKPSHHGPSCYQKQKASEHNDTDAHQPHLFKGQLLVYHTPKSHHNAQNRLPTLGRSYSAQNKNNTVHIHTTLHVKKIWHCIQNMGAIHLISYVYTCGLSEVNLARSPPLISFP